MNKTEMDFDSYLEKTLTIEPFYGWGWVNFQGESTEVPEPFTVTLKRLSINQHNGLAGVGYITSEHHSLKHRWVVFSQRHYGSASLREKGTHYNISIRLAPPAVDEDESVSEGEIPSCDERIYGYAFVYLNE